jgi:hypothetical protein
MFGRKQQNKAVFVTQEDLDAEYEEKVKRLEQLEREDKKAAEKNRKVLEEQRQREVAIAELSDGVRRHEEEQRRRKEKKEREAESRVGAQPVSKPVTSEMEDHDTGSEVDDLDSNPRRERATVTVGMTPVDSEVSTKNEVTEKVTPPIIGSSPSIFSRTPWSKTDRPLHGLSMNGFAGDVHCDAGTFGKLASIGATLRGQKHQVPDRTSGAAGQNEDWFSTFCAVSRDKVKYVVTVVCDGLSSAPYSWYGARRTSTTLARDVATGIGGLSEVSSQTLQTLVDESLSSQSSTLLNWNSNEYGAPQIDPSQVQAIELGCTVTLAVVCAEPDETGTHRLVVGNVGDSPVFNLANSTWRKVSPIDIDSGGILDTKTHAFPRHTNCVLVDDVMNQGECLLVTSDGVGNFILRNDVTLALGNYLATRWSEPIGILSFLNHLSFDLPTADDDRTAVAFWPA